MIWQQPKVVERRVATAADFDDRAMDSIRLLARGRVQAALTDPNSPYDTAKISKDGMPIGRIQGVWSVIDHDGPYEAPKRVRKVAVKKAVTPVEDKSPEPVHDAPSAAADAAGAATPGGQR